MTIFKYHKAVWNLVVFRVDNTYSNCDWLIKDLKLQCREFEQDRIFCIQCSKAPSNWACPSPVIS